MPPVALEKTLRALQNRGSESRTERLAGTAWLRKRLQRGRFGMCEEHSHAECVECGSVKCVGNHDRYETITQRCDCGKTEHLIVPFDNFGQHVGFSN